MTEYLVTYHVGFRKTYKLINGKDKVCAERNFRRLFTPEKWKKIIVRSIDKSGLNLN